MRGGTKYGCLTRGCEYRFDDKDAVNTHVRVSRRAQSELRSPEVSPN